jgi:hypothetical protein
MCAVVIVIFGVYNLSETILLTVLKSVARKRLVKTENILCAVDTLIFGLRNSVRLLCLLVVTVRKG